VKNEELPMSYHNLVTKHFLIMPLAGNRIYIYPIAPNNWDLQPVCDNPSIIT